MKLIVSQSCSKFHYFFGLIRENNGKCKIHYTKFSNVERRYYLYSQLPENSLSVRMIWSLGGFKHDHLILPQDKKIVCSSWTLCSMHSQVYMEENKQFTDTCRIIHLFTQK